MKEFDYDLDYKSLDFTNPETRKLYRIGRGEQGVLLVRPYTEDICQHWRFKDVPTLINLLIKYTKCSATTGGRKISLVWTWRGSSLKWVLRELRRYANHNSGRKYDVSKTILPQENDALTSEKAQAAQVFKKVRDLAAYDPEYQMMRKQWRKSE